MKRGRETRSNKMVQLPLIVVPFNLSTTHLSQLIWSSDPEMGQNDKIASASASFEQNIV